MKRALPLALGVALGCAPQVEPTSAFARLSELGPQGVEARDVTAQSLLMPLQLAMWVLQLDSCSPKSCPSVEEDTDVARIVGGCTDEDGVTWEGSALVHAPDEDHLRIDFEDFGMQEGATSLWLNGSVALDNDDGLLDVSTGDLEMQMSGPPPTEDGAPPWSAVPVHLYFEAYSLLADDDGTWSLQSQISISVDEASPQLAVLDGAGWADDDLVSGSMLVTGNTPAVLGVGGTPDAPQLWVE